MLDTHFDVIILGTGLTESIAAAALSKAGFKVAHLDQNPYYGGDEASLTLDELIQWADVRTTPNADPTIYTSAQTAKFSSVSHSSNVLPNSRQYSLSLSPSLIPSTGPLISSLIGSSVSRYGGYKLLDRIAVFDASGKVRNVPGSKEDVFKSKDLSLLEKRRLMRFLTFASGEFEGKPELEGNEDTSFAQFLKSKFSQKEDVIDTIAYALAFCTSPSDPTFLALQRIRHYLLSSGRYGSSPFLVGQYGGAGEIAQGFCRVSAVHGGVYILGRKIMSITENKNTEPTPRFTVKIDDLADDLTCDLIISSSDYLPPHLCSSAYSPIPENSASQTGNTSPTSLARCIAVFDGPIILPTSPSHEASQSTDDPPTSSPDMPESGRTNPDSDTTSQSKVDTAILVFPPGSLPSGSPTTSASVLLTGEGTLSTPTGKCIAYISLPVGNPDTSAETLLKPYLEATLAALTQQSSPEPLFSLFYTLSSLPSPFPSSPPTSPSRVIVTPKPSYLLPESMDTATTNAETVFWEAVKVLQVKSEGGEDGKIESFWPPLELQDEDEESW